MIHRRPGLSVSVIIPTYNRARLVRRAVESALGQTRVPDEVIVVDDGSTDDTAEALRRYGDPVRVIRQANAGRSAARNVGLRQACGDLVAFLDSDDSLVPESIACRKAAFEQDTELGVVYTDAQLFDGERTDLPLFSEVYPVSHPSGMILAELARRCFIVLSSVMFRRDVAAAHGIFFDESIGLAEDYDYWLRMAAVSRFRYLEQPLVKYRIPAGAEISVSDWGLPSVSARLHDQQLKQHEILVQRRAMKTGAFRALGRGERARVHCAHGTKNMLAGNMAAARRVLRQAVGIAPAYPAGWALLGLSACGPRVFEFAVLLRRRLIWLMATVAG